MSTPKVLILTGDAGESLEVMYPYQRLQMVSARAWPDHPSWMREFIRLLRKKAPLASKETAGVR